MKGSAAAMANITLGRAGLVVNKNGFGALPIQRLTKEEAAVILKKAQKNGITFFDTAVGYSDSEEKIGYALSDVRDQIYLATKTPAKNGEDLKKDLETSLSRLKTDHIDLYQFHNPSFVPKPGDGTGLYEAMLEAKKEGKIRFIGITNHRLAVAIEAVESGLYDTLQFPFSYLASEKDIDLVRLCEKNNVGFIAMKGMSGGIITNGAAAYAFMNQFDNVLPIWGIQREKELDEFLSYDDNPPSLSGDVKELIEHDKVELSGNFCRGCGYCQPCPAEIEISLSARMSWVLRRMPSERFLTPEWQEKMERIENCIHCNHCVNHCPYGLNTPELLKQNLIDYREYLKEHSK